ncbi:hypothetical protein GGD61_007968 [Bradyrhizobium sp. SBR1B]|nr:hypothetical protein [Bradyrhizobium sp. SBR1B]
MASRHAHQLRRFARSYPLGQSPSAREPGRSPLGSSTAPSSLKTPEAHALDKSERDISNGEDGDLSKEGLYKFYRIT